MSSFRSFLSNYPPGESGRARSGAAEMRCVNDECELYDDVIEVAGYCELGGWFFEREGDAFCPECG